MTIAEHSVRLDLFSHKATILDLGCRGFEFANYFRRKHLVYCVDLMDADEKYGDNYYQIAISDNDGWCGTEETQDIQATHIKEGNEIKKMTLDSFSKFVKVEKWDLIKMDIEGEEIKILQSSIHPIAAQVSVEFHAHCGQKKEDIDALLDYLNYWYRIENAVWDERHGAGFNYWDVLLIAKR